MSSTAVTADPSGGGHVRRDSPCYSVTAKLVIMLHHCGHKVLLSAIFTDYTVEQEIHLHDDGANSVY